MNVPNDSVTLYYLGVCASGEGRGASLIFRRKSMWLKIVHSNHIKAKSHYANIPICFIPQVSPFYIVEKVK